MQERTYGFIEDFTNDTQLMIRQLIFNSPHIIIIIMETANYNLVVKMLDL